MRELHARFGGAPIALLQNFTGVCMFLASNEVASPMLLCFTKPRSMKTTIIRTSLAFTIVACLTICALNVIRVREKISGLQTNLQAQTEARQRADNDLRRTRTELGVTTAALTQTKSAMESALADKQKAQ